MQTMGYELLELLGVSVSTMAGYPALVIEYRRTGTQGPVRVQLIQVVTDDQDLEINLSYRESEVMFWKPVVAKIRQSIRIETWR
jgi:hypothetical protein